MPSCSRFLIICISFFLPVIAFSQSAADRDLTGLWRGTMYNDTTQLNYRYEIAISEKKGKLYGFSHTFFILDNREYHGVKRLKIKVKGDEVITEDMELIVHNYPIQPPKGVHEKNILRFELRDNMMVLSGRFMTNRTREYAPATGTINVERKNDYKNSALIPHLEELQLKEELSFAADIDKAKTRSEIIPVAVPEEHVVKAAVAEKEKTVSQQPVAHQPVVKATPVTKTEEQPVAKTTTVVKETAVVAKTTTPAQAKPVTSQPVVKTTPVKKEEPVAEKIVKAPQQDLPKNVNGDPMPKIYALPSHIDAKKRTIETIQALYFKTDSLVLTLYDNGEVDGDTVSVLMNGNVIMPRVGLSTNAVSQTIYTRGVEDSIQIIMYAETLGSLPPNTGLLIVYDGKDRYEIRFSGDMERSSAIVFRRQRKL